ncbi:DUF1961 family protein [Cyclobacterium plantarum]|uniref:DUF1961 family protein n=1 Tax=Cyclobacterium plantarum TaxID=2716263 RepID=UPI003F71C900
MRTVVFLFLSVLLSFHECFCQIQGIQKGELIYQNNMDSEGAVNEWIMEGPGQVRFKDGWMEMYSPEEKFHHVFWCPVDFPGSFIAEWEAQNLNIEVGLCIIFFSAKGNNGAGIFDTSFPKRDGTFTQYTKSEHISAYHISYYANGMDNPGREISHLRKNSGFHLVQQMEPGIPISSEKVHKLKLVKNDSRILMYIDNRKIIDWVDEKDLGPVLQEGKIGFRQMKWTHFRYKNFKVWELSK